MSQPLLSIYMARHGETAWSLSGQHTGLTDLPLTERGERNARALGERLKGLTFTRVFTSPLQRARRTCELAGFGSVATVDRELVEWNYGECEGLTTADIRKKRPDWQLFRDGGPGGESVAEVGARADRVLSRLKAIDGGVLVARWIGLDPAGGKLLFLSTASLSILGYEHGKNDPVLRLWNDVSHVTQ